jgi:putative transposase
MAHYVVNFRRYYVPGATVFITQVVRDRKPVFTSGRYMDLLRSTLRLVKDLHPFSMVGYVFLHDHLHLLITPTGDSNFSEIMHSLKPNFTKAYKQAQGIEGNVAFWQRRFWDHVIRDDEDLNRHLDYIHYNPVKHGLVTRPADWQHSSFISWKERGAYPDHWGQWEPAELAAGDYAPQTAGDYAPQTAGDYAPQTAGDYASVTHSCDGPMGGVWTRCRSRLQRDNCGW